MRSCFNRPFDPLPPCWCRILNQCDVATVQIAGVRWWQSFALKGVGGGTTKVAYSDYDRSPRLTCMGPRSSFRPNEDVAALSSRVLQLFRQALPDPSDRDLFNRFMHEARSRGLSWVDGLEYTAKRRRSL